jgi:hypothetical protein
MKKQLIKFNQHNYDKAVRFANVDLSAYNKLLSDIRPFVSALKLTLDKDLLSSLLQNAKEYAFNAVVDKNPLTIGGIPVSKQKAMELIEMPENWTKIITSIEAFKRVISANPVHKDSANDYYSVNRITLEQMDFVKGAFIIKEDFFANLKEINSLYTQNENQNKAHSAIMQIYEGFEKLKDLGVLVAPSLEVIGINITYGLSGANVSYNRGPVISNVK